MAAVDVDVLRAVFRRHAVHEPLRLLHLTQKVALSSSSVAAPFPPLLGSLMTVDLALGGLGGVQRQIASLLPPWRRHWQPRLSPSPQESGGS